MFRNKSHESQDLNQKKKERQKNKILNCLILQLFYKNRYRNYLARKSSNIRRESTAIEMTVRSLWF